MTRDTPLDRLKHHVSGAIARGEKEAITEVSAIPTFNTHSELIAASTDVSRYKNGSIASYRPPEAYNWRCATCGNVFPHTMDRAYNVKDGMHCYACCHKRDIEELKDRSRPFTCYLSSDGKTVSNWPGSKLGDVIASTPVKLTRPSFTHGKYMQAVRVRDVHGSLWYGRGSPGICITLRPMKG